MESLPTSTPTPLPEDLRLVTAKDFIQITERATANAVEMPGYKRFLEKLFAVPEVRERLAFEGMAIAWDSLSAGTEPPGPALTLACMLPKDSRRVAEHTDWLEKLAFKSFELRKALLNSPGQHGPFCLPLMMLLTALDVRNPGRFESMMSSLKAAGADPSRDSRWSVLKLVEDSARKRRNAGPGEGADS